MTAVDPKVYIIDDDAGVLDSLVVLLELQGFRTEPFTSAELFLQSCSPHSTGCVLADLRLPGMSGLQLQLAMQERNIALPVIIISAHGDLPAARAAFKSGAVDFLEKPLERGQLAQVIRTALARDKAAREHALHCAKVDRLMDRLTERERAVLAAVVAGRHNREIAADLGISARTVEVHKSRLMSKLGVERVPDLIRLVLSAAPPK